MQGFYAAQEGHIVQALAPVDINGGASSDVFSLAGHRHATIIIALGVTGAASTVTLEECDDFTPSNSNAIPFTYFAEETAGGDTLGAKQAATAAAGFDTSTEDGVFYVIEVDAAELSDGFPNLRVVLSDPALATFASVIAILSGSRYSGDQSASAIA